MTAKPSGEGAQNNVQLGEQQRPIGNEMASIWESSAVQLGERRLPRSKCSTSSENSAGPGYPRGFSLRADYRSRLNVVSSFRPCSQSSCARFSSSFPRGEDRKPSTSTRRAPDFSSLTGICETGTGAARCFESFSRSALTWVARSPGPLKCARPSSRISRGSTPHVWGTWCAESMSAHRRPSDFTYAANVGNIRAMDPTGLRLSSLLINSRPRVLRSDLPYPLPPSPAP